MAKIWDILPPPPRPAPKNKKTTSRKRVLSLWYLVILVVFSFVFIFGGSWAKLKYFDNVPSPTPLSSPSSAVVKTQGNLSIKILNSTGRFEEATKVKEILTKNGFNVSATETAVNTYDQTIIYYNPTSTTAEKYALQIADLLKSYNAKTQKFSQSSNYDIAIIIGGKLY